MFLGSEYPGIFHLTLPHSAHGQTISAHLTLPPRYGGAPRPHRPLPVPFTIIFPTTPHKCATLQNKGFLQLFIVRKDVGMMQGLYYAGILLCGASGN